MQSFLYFVTISLSTKLAVKNVHTDPNLMCRNAGNLLQHPQLNLKALLPDQLGNLVECNHPQPLIHSAPCAFNQAPAQLHNSANMPI